MFIPPFIRHPVDGRLALGTVRVRSPQLAQRGQSGALYLLAATYGRSVYQPPVTTAMSSRPTFGPPAEAEAPLIEQEPEGKEGDEFLTSRFEPRP